MSLTDEQIGSWVHRLTEAGKTLTKPHYCESVVAGAAVVSCGKTLPDTDEGDMWGAGDIEGRCKTCSRRRRITVNVTVTASDVIRIPGSDDDGSTHDESEPA